MKIILIGCPGSGKSTLTRRMNEILHYPVLHLDSIYHIDNTHHITREELKQKVANFASENENWIIDGNYKNTIPQRVELADTIILLDIATEVCLANAQKRTKQKHQTDMAKGFDISKINDGFLEFIEKFKNEIFPKILQIVNSAKGKKLILLKDYSEVDALVERLKKNGTF